MRVQRSRFLFFFFRSGLQVDLLRLLRGDIDTRPRDRLSAFALAGGRRPFDIEPAGLRLLATVPADAWSDAPTDDEQAAILQSLCREGALISDSDTPEARAIRAAETRLQAGTWDPIAALFMAEAERASVPPSRTAAQRAPATPFRTIVDRTAESFERFVTRHGPPPPPFYVRDDAERRIPLPRPADSPLAALLASRRTHRTFDEARTLPLDRLSTALSRSFGVLGTTAITPEIELLQRSSPSAGSLHPIEPYVLARDVSGLPSGLFHYNTQAPALDTLERFPASAAAELAVQALAGQDYARGASALVILVARLDRAMWKYRENVRVPLVVAMDAGHLSQTFYLACTELDLACFLSAAIDMPLLRDRLSLPPEHVPIAVLGCGHPHPDGDPLGLARTAT